MNRSARTRVASLCAALLAGALPAAPSRACTSFCLDTPGGPIFATNMDLRPSGDGLVLVNRRGIAKANVRPNADGTTTTWTSTYGSVTFHLFGRGFAWSGMNEAGLAVSTMGLAASRYPKPDERPPFDVGSFAQYVLDTCGSVGDVLEAARRVRFVDDGDGRHHLMVVDAAGDGAAIESLHGRLACRTGEDFPIRAMTDMQYEHALAAYERGAPHWWWSNPGESAERFAAAAERMEQYDAAREDSATIYALAALMRTVAVPETKWNIVYDIAAREVHYRTAESPQLKFLALRDFDLACDAPLRMLSINAPLTGNVEPEFTPYDSSVNLDIHRNACLRFGVEVSEETSIRLMRLFGGFACAGEPGGPH